MKTTRHPAPARDALPDGVGQYLENIGRHELLTADEEIELAQAIEAGTAAKRALEEGAYATPAERLALRRAVSAGDEARDRFVAANLRLVVANARRYAGSAGIELLDLIQEGNLGLIRAVEKFDWRKGFKFSTYATWWIRQAITRALAEKTRVVRLPGQLHDTLGAVRSAAADLRARLGREARPDEIAEETGVDPAVVAKALAVGDAVSIDQPVGDDGAHLGDFIADEDADDPVVRSEHEAVSDDLREALHRLPPREERILAMRYGFLPDETPRTLDEIGDEFRLTRERIRQIERRALCKLRHPAFGLREQDLW